MDPLSIAASITGLLAVTSKLRHFLHHFILNVRDAPDLSKSAFSAVKEMNFALSFAQRLLSNLTSLQRDRKAMIEVEYLVIILTQSVITITELEKLVCPTSFQRDKRQAWERLKWVWKEESVSRAVLRLEGHKSSMSLLLNILQW
jgi:hypothetical protein